jgi:hypothetical protein
MNLPRARQLAQQGLSIKDAAKKLGVSPFRLGVAADKHGIQFAAVTRRPADWERPEEPEAMRLWYAGQKRNLTSGWSGRGR